MSQTRYERYKDALRRGHVAALRGRHAEALAAYAEAAGLAPDRPLPLASRGSVLRAIGRTDEALGAYRAALALAPRDEATLAGRAALLIHLERRTEAAEDLTTLAEVHEAAGRLDDASDAIRRALELGEARSRRRLAERLADRLRASGADAAAIARLDGALRVLEPGDALGVGLGAPSAADAADDADAADAVATGAAGTSPTEATPPPADPAILEARAAAADSAPDPVVARDGWLSILADHRAAGRWDAAMDAGLRLLELDPAAVVVHARLAELELDRGWSALAGDKLRLLRRLAELTSGEAERGTSDDDAIVSGLEARLGLGA